ncbi:hypothetical protein [Methylobacterium sp. 17Sr1-1]|nr:hypothetical protein [Methylobacterium sp. 17Sr1-1]
MEIKPLADGAGQQRARRKVIPGELKEVPERSMLPAGTTSNTHI